MDIYCPRCGEPFDPDEFGDIAAELGSTYYKISRRFFTLGCGIALATKPCPQRDTPQGRLAGELYGWLTSDVDGIAAELENAQAAGMFDEVW